MIKLKLIFFGIILALNLHAQDWFEGSPSWSYEYYCGFWVETFGYDNIRFVKDTILDNKNVKMFLREGKRTTIGPNSTTWNTGGKLYFYEADNKIWEYIPQNDTDQLLYDYELTTGDTLFIDSNPGDLCGDTLYYIVHSVGVTNIDGYDLEYQDIIIADSANYFEGEIIRVIEKIGATGYNYYDIKLNYSCLFDACRQFTLTCYENKDLELSYPDSLSCEVLSDISNLIDEPLDIFPNPVNDYFILTEIEAYETIEIFDINGKVVLKEKIRRNKINFNLSPGLYIVKVMNKNEKIHIGKFIKK